MKSLLSFWPSKEIARQPLHISPRDLLAVSKAVHWRTSRGSQGQERWAFDEQFCNYDSHLSPRRKQQDKLAAGNPSFRLTERFCLLCQTCSIFYIFILFESRSIRSRQFLLELPRLPFGFRFNRWHLNEQPSGIRFHNSTYPWLSLT